MNYSYKVILGGLMGNLVKAYDVSICYFLSNELTTVLLGNNASHPMVILTLICLAYVAKPIGAIFLGLCSDRFGRKNVLVASIFIMGLSTTAIGLIPSHAYIGLIAPLFFLMLRLIQAMASGAEFLNSASFLMESGGKNRRCFRGCWPSVGVKGGFLLACLMGQAVHHNAFYWAHDWAWRLPFMFAFITTGIGLFIRYNMPEGIEYIRYYATRKKPTTATICKQSWAFMKHYPLLFNYAFFSSLLSVATGFFFYLYIPLHAINHSVLSTSFIMFSTMWSLIAVTLLIPLFGLLSDQCDRLKMLSFATSGLLIMAYPFMHAINYGSAGCFLIMQLLISIPCACYYSVASVLMIELFPLPIRCTLLSFIFSIAASMGAGLPPLLANGLVKITDKLDSPCLLMIVISCIVLNNIRLLAHRYRLGINHYHITFFQDEPSLFTAHYQKTM